jgi:hypothetical protein
MKYLKPALILFFCVDTLMFLVYQTAPDILATALPQFDIESAGGAYPRLVGKLFLMLGLARLYGGLFILSENIVALVLAPLMLGWSLVYYQKRFRGRGADVDLAGDDG